MPESQPSSTQMLIIKLCKDALKQADYRGPDFFLDMAFRSQSLLHSAEWELLQKTNPLEDHKVEQFAQKIVDEVVQSNSNQDTWAMKLKTRYLGKLSKTLTTTNQALSTVSACSLSTQNAKSAAADTSKNCLKALEAQANYLNSMIDLPFILEKVVLGLLKQSPTANFQPKKTAVMLAMALDTVQSASALTGVSMDVHLVQGLKLAIEIAMPSDILEARLVHIISTELLPFIKERLIKNTREVNQVKALLFPQTEDGLPSNEALAHKQVFANMGVHFESIQEVLSDTLLEPVAQLTQAYIDANGVVEAVSLALQEDNWVNKLLNIGKAFNHLDKIYMSYQAPKDANLPNWLQETDQYYLELKQGINAMGQGFNQGLSVLYGYASSLLPEIFFQYFTPTNAQSLSALIKDVDDEEAPEHIERVMAYYAFYDLVQTTHIAEGLKALCFKQFMKEAHTVNFELKGEPSDYEDYLILEDQFNRKLRRGHLKERLEDRNPFMRTQTTVDAFKKAKMPKMSLEKIEVLALIYELQRIESRFNSSCPLPTFKALVGCGSNLKHKRLFIEKFLKPAKLRILGQFQNEHLLPLLEYLLDTKGLPSKQLKIRRLYAHLKKGSLISKKDMLLVENCIHLAATLPVSKDKIRVQLIGFKTLIEEDSPTQNPFEYKNEPSESKEPTLHFAPKNYQPLQFRSLFLNGMEHKEGMDFTDKTPKEVQKQQAFAMVETYAQKFKPLLQYLSQNLDEQYEACDRFLTMMTSEDEADSSIVLLCRSKLSYIDAIQGFITQLDSVGELHQALVALLTGEIPFLSLESLEEKRKALSLKTMSEKLINFIGVAMPHETFFRNLLNYYVKDTLLAEVVAAENCFKENLNNNPISATLMQVLTDPLSVQNLIPSQEKIMDEVVSQLVEQGISTGAGYLKQAFARLSSEYLLKLMPYPFLAELTLQVINSEPVQTQINIQLNNILLRYGSFFGAASKDFKEQVKMKLYPLLNIEIQKTIQSDAYRYALNQNSATDTERDAFVIYFLQYRELKFNKPDLNPTTAIRALFCDLLEVENPETLETIAQAFTVLETKLNQQLLENQLLNSDKQLGFLIETLDFNTQENDILIQLALINRLLIIKLKASEQSSGAEQIMLLQADVVMQLSALLKRANQHLTIPEPQSSPLQEIKALPEDKQTTYQAIRRALSGTPNKLVRQMQLKQVALRIDTTLSTIETGLSEYTAMKATPNLMGVSLLQWEYNNSPRSRKMVYALKIILEAWSCVFALMGIILPIIASTGLFAVLSASLIGMVGTVLAPIALLRLSYKLGMEIFIHKLDFKNASWLGVLPLAFKCLFLALGKTLFTDHLLVKISTLIDPLKRASLVFYTWPNQPTIEAEEKSLAAVKTQLTVVKELISKQLQNNNAQLDPLTNALVPDQSQALKSAVVILEGSWKNALKQLNQTSKFTDARFVHKNHQSCLYNHEKNFNLLKKEIDSLLSLQTAQHNLFPIISAPSVAIEPVQPLLQGEEVKFEQPEIKSIGGAVIVNIHAFRQRQVEKNPSSSSPSPVLEEKNETSPNPGMTDYLYSTIWGSPPQLTDPVITNPTTVHSPPANLA
ncbi:MAG: hypothetical protein H0U75_13170 [Legionella sp.]|nr:hypothetical protein [Legionella sp.]